MAVPPTPRFGPHRRRVVDPLQVDLVEYLEAHPPAAPAWAAPKVVEAEVARPSTGLRALRVSADVADDPPDDALLPGPSSRTGAAPPRIPFIGEIVHLARLTFGREAWAARAADALGVSERQMRRWRVLGNPATRPRPSAEHLERMRDAAEAHHAEMSDALRRAGRLPEAEAPASEAADAPHVRRGEPVPEAGTLPVELGEPGHVEPPQAARKGPTVDEG